MNIEQKAFLITAGLAQFIGVIWLYLDAEPRGPDLGRKFVAMEIVVVMLGLFFSWMSYLP